MLKKMTKCLLVSQKYYNFAADYKRNIDMMSKNLLNGLIIIRLQSAVGSDKACR